MRSTSARILKGLHDGFVLQVFVGRGSRDPDTYRFVTWQVDEVEGEAFRRTERVAEGHRRGFSHAAADDLGVDCLIAWLPNTDTNALHSLTPAGLAEAQALYGPIVAEVLVKHEADAELVSPIPDGAAAVPAGTMDVPDFTEDDAAPSL
ncbi:hypothetical protein [Methylorubrum sp. SB2]|uniref:hypothetical protein n=1 Tax=Methylorubrum subtropicum TaxID=3138812 RepID=UPI00313B7ED0